MVTAEKVINSAYHMNFWQQNRAIIVQKGNL